MDLKEIRRKRLELLAKRHSLAGNPSGLGKLIGKEPNQVYNLLNGFSSFGEKVARSIEEKAGLPTGWLDIDPESAAAPVAFAPDVLLVASELSEVPVDQRDTLIQLFRNTIAMTLATSKKKEAGRRTHGHAQQSKRGVAK